jgi:hypothetical protein
MRTEFPLGHWNVPWELEAQCSVHISPAEAERLSSRLFFDQYITDGRLHFTVEANSDSSQPN